MQNGTNKEAGIKNQKEYFCCQEISPQLQILRCTTPQRIYHTTKCKDPYFSHTDMAFGLVYKELRESSEKGYCVRVWHASVVGVPKELKIAFLTAHPQYH